ncbi:acylphosphatase [Candidatus Daviesbacteria bacterium]|nr:acylphosphatase [Candidatus Daviesbacteria bacterium]
MIKHLNIKIFGLVQGVFFRTSAKDQADRLNIKGFAKNMPDGSVYIEAEGEKENLEKFVKWCNTGSSIAKVEKVEFFEASLKSFKKFDVF